MKLSSLAALEVVKVTTSSTASDENFVKMTTFLFQCTWANVIQMLWRHMTPINKSHWVIAFAGELCRDVYWGCVWNMMTLLNGNFARVTGPLWGESSGHRWIALTKASNAEIWYFLWSAPEQTVEQTMETKQASDLRRHHAHYDATIMKIFSLRHRIVSKIIFIAGSWSATRHVDPSSRERGIRHFHCLLLRTQIGLRSSGLLAAAGRCRHRAGSHGQRRRQGRQESGGGGRQGQDHTHKYETHWGRKKWPPFTRRHFQTHFLNENFDFRLRFHWSLFLRVDLTISQH